MGIKKQIYFLADFFQYQTYVESGVLYTHTASTGTFTIGTSSRVPVLKIHSDCVSLIAYVTTLR
jgi:hypothetical protein